MASGTSNVAGGRKEHPSENLPGRDTSGNRLGKAMPHQYKSQHGIERQQGQRRQGNADRATGRQHIGPGTKIAPAPEEDRDQTNANDRVDEIDTPDQMRQSGDG